MIIALNEAKEFFGKWAREKTALEFIMSSAGLMISANVRVFQFEQDREKLVLMQPPDLFFKEAKRIEISQPANVLINIPLALIVRYEFVTPSDAPIALREYAQERMEHMLIMSIGVGSTVIAYSGLIESN